MKKLLALTVIVFLSACDAMPYMLEGIADGASEAATTSNNYNSYNNNYTTQQWHRTKSNDGYIRGGAYHYCEVEDNSYYYYATDRSLVRSRRLAREYCSSQSNYCSAPRCDSRYN